LLPPAGVGAHAGNTKVGAPSSAGIGLPPLSCGNKTLPRDKISQSWQAITNAIAALANDMRQPENELG
jgi:hypothetical protein